MEYQAPLSFSKIYILIEKDTNPKIKINEFQELLNSKYAEKEETSQNFLLT